MPPFPIAPKRPHEITQHGQTRSDEYFWMRYREDPAVIEYLQAENEYLEEVMQHSNPLQAQLFEEMNQRQCLIGVISTTHVQKRASNTHITAENMDRSRLPKKSY